MPKAALYDPEQIPDLSGKVFFITGGTTGVGRETILQWAKHNPARIYFTGRNRERAEQVTAEAKKISPNTEIIYVQLDMTSLTSVKDAIQPLTIPRLDILVCNAGVCAIGPGLSKEGYEVQFAINHMAHALMIKLLLPTLRATKAISGAAPRIVLLTSEAARFFVKKEGVDFVAVRTEMESGKFYKVFERWERYGQSKVANIQYAAELAKREPEIVAVAVHPGVSNTELVSTMPFGHRWFVYIMSGRDLVPANEMAWNTLWATTAPEGDLENGSYYLPVGKLDKTESHVMHNKELAAKLYDWTQKELEAF